jgi:hypothetical protein
MKLAGGLDQLLAYAAFVRHQLNVISLIAEGSETTARAERARAKVERELAEMGRDLETARRLFDRLYLSEKRIDDRWRLSRGAEKAAAPYRRASKQLRSTLAKPDELLPDPSPIEPFLIEARLTSEGELSAQRAVLRPSGDI